MTISANSTEILSRHWLATPLPTPGTHLFVFSGIARFDEAIKGI